jgi:AmiR/NasT family two-component response regulator
MVERAKGIVMVAHACDDAAAFAVLRVHAAQRGLRVSDLARRLVDEIATRPLPEVDACREALGELLDRLGR